MHVLLIMKFSMLIRGLKEHSINVYCWVRNQCLSKEINDTKISFCNQIRSLLFTKMSIFTFVLISVLQKDSRQYKYICSYLWSINWIFVNRIILSLNAMYLNYSFVMFNSNQLIMFACDKYNPKWKSVLSFYDKGFILINNLHFFCHYRIRLKIMLRTR